MQGGLGIPKFYMTCEEGDQCVLIMERLGRNLEDQRIRCKDHLSLSTTLYLIDQMVFLQ